MDLRLGHRFTTFNKPPKYLPGIHVDKSLWAEAGLWEHVEVKDGGHFALEPGGFVLAQTLETVHIPNDLVGFVEGRSSWARCGITIHVTAPKIDPGFDAPITLEMANFSKVTVFLRPAVDVPAQLMLLSISTPLGQHEVYGSDADDIFQHQTHPIPIPPKS